MGILYYWVLQTSSNRKNRIEKAEREARNEFFYFLWKLPNNQYGKYTNMDFSQNFEM